MVWLFSRLEPPAASKRELTRGGWMELKMKTRIVRSWWRLACAVEVAAGASLAPASAAPSASPEAPRTTRNVEGISDNSFLVEEAYNQEPGVVQHIVTAAWGIEAEAGPDTESWGFAFTQEWPLFSQTHQLSYTVPYSVASANGRAGDGFGDVLLNYRFQAWYDSATLSAAAPRVSLILPTGDDDQGFGEDTLGYQFNLPLSTAINDKWFVHLNAGTTFLPDAASASGRDLWHYNLGASGIYAATRDLHFLVEWVGAWIEAPRAGGGLGHEFVSVIVPGFRKAFTPGNDVQIVLGAAAPIGLTGSAPDIGVFLYLSVEHSFLKPK